MGNTGIRVGVSAITVALLVGCSGWEPIDYHETSDIPQGAGLISGKKGGWTIFRIEEKKKEPKTDTTAEADAPDKETDPIE